VEKAGVTARLNSGILVDDPQLHTSLRQQHGGQKSHRTGTYNQNLLSIFRWHINAGLREPVSAPYHLI
jgi:hypothetical protein